MGIASEEVAAAVPRCASTLRMAVAEEEVAAHGEEDSAGAAAAGMYHRE